MHLCELGSTVSSAGARGSFSAKKRVGEGRRAWFRNCWIFIQAELLGVKEEGVLLEVVCALLLHAARSRRNLRFSAYPPRLQSLAGTVH